MQMIGVLGGTFNPIHHGHLRIAQETAEAFALSEVKFVPAASPPLKDQPVVSAQHRAAMVRLAIAGNPLFSLDTLELTRSGPSYTIDTLIALRAQHPAAALCLIIGNDAFARFDQWHRWQSILDYCHLVVVSRPPVLDSTHANLSNVNTANRTLSNMPFNSKASARLSAPLENLLKQHHTDNIAQLRQQAHGLIAMHTVTALAISSSQIRQLVHQHKNPVYLCPEPVIAYIKEHCLYKT